eukprot:TRINITY_DN750_c0_g1_i8.p1 TRINITY_DN750_c0_g1~~TRINITY_DN750_c0_g1_i8.p1  ORF type:complete len:134 (-),score=38.36 TRINITY_DN750_c0_g1_i8:67-468(-)
MCAILQSFFFFFFQAEDGIRDAQESRGLGDVYKRQSPQCSLEISTRTSPRITTMRVGQPFRKCGPRRIGVIHRGGRRHWSSWLLTRCTTPTTCVSGTCLLYTSDAADEEDSVDLGGRRIIKKKKKRKARNNVS